MKKLIALLLALVMVLGMVACGGEKAPEATEAAPEATEAAPGDEEPIELTFLCAQYSDGTEPYIKKVIEAFEAENPGITVKLEIVGWDDLTANINAKVAGNMAPDIFAGSSASAFLEDGLVYYPSEIVSEELQADFYQTFWDNNYNAEFDAVVQIPFVASVRSLYCNKKIFDEVGITEVPKTWSEVEAACEQIYNHYNGDVYAWGIDATMTEGQALLAYVGWNNGGGFVDDNMNYIIDCDANIEAYEWAKKLYDNGWTNTSPATEIRDDLQKLVAGDKMAMLLTANFFPALYPEVELLMGATPYNEKTMDHSVSMAVQDALIFFNDSCKNVEDTPARKAAITKFTDFFYSAEWYLPYCQMEGLLPATASGIEALVAADPSQAAYIEILGNAKFYPRARADFADCTTGLCEAGGKIFSNQMSVADALHEVQDLLS